MKSVLLTRSTEGNKETIEEIARYNINNLKFNYIHCPLIEYKNLNFTSKILNDYSNIIITSKYAAHILKEQSKDSNYNVWVVGESSKIILESSGFIVKYVAKNVGDLIEYFPPDLYNQAIYLSSNEITHDLPSQIKRKIIYKVKYLNKLSPSFDCIDYVLLYSQNSAKTLLNLLRQNNLLESLQNSLFITISLKVANIIRPFFKNVVYCDDENPYKIINLLIRNAESQN
ncbi:uroporphyrinogen-III synthase [Rickettsia endosymbiont of Halotydeus destructor]|uniref:uroporphyrinogen-III synthase n=1 Tax=Rickettsia endosymbiont of Halotydeus destructor TaxID=2996754 RepID=UPI003BAFF3A3